MSLPQKVYFAEQRTSLQARHSSHLNSRGIVVALDEINDEFGNWIEGFEAA